MILSIVVYTSLAATLSGLGWHLWKREERLKAATGQTLPFWSWEIIVSILVFAVVAGARYHTGYDHAAYLGEYLHYQKYGFFSRDYEPLFLWVTQAMAGNHIHYFFYFAFWAALEITLLYFALAYKKELIPWVALLLVLGPVFLHLMNTLRQGIVECSVPLLIVLLNNRKYFVFCIMVGLLTMIHTTAIFLFVLFLVRTFSSGKHFRNISVIFFLFAVVVGAMPFWLDWFTRLAQDLISGSVVHYGTIQSINNHHFTIAFGPVRVIMLLSQLTVLWFSLKSLSFFEKNRFMQLMAFFAAIYSIGSALMCNTTNFFQRPIELFVISFVVFAASTVYMLFMEKKTMAAIVIIALNITLPLLSIMKAYFYPNPSNLTSLYHLFFVY